jgi:hypothetical protein
MRRQRGGTHGAPGPSQGAASSQEGLAPTDRATAQPRENRRKGRAEKVECDCGQICRGKKNRKWELKRASFHAQNPERVLKARANVGGRHVQVHQLSVHQKQILVQQFCRDGHLKAEGPLCWRCLEWYADCSATVVSALLEESTRDIRHDYPMFDDPAKEDHRFSNAKIENARPKVVVCLNTWVQEHTSPSPYDLPALKAAHDDAATKRRTLFLACFVSEWCQASQSFNDYLEEQNERPVHYQTFHRLMRDHYPNVRKKKHTKDFCKTCGKYLTALQKLTKGPQSQKRRNRLKKRTRRWERHRRHALGEYREYKRASEASTEAFNRWFAAEKEAALAKHRERHGAAAELHEDWFPEISRCSNDFEAVISADAMTNVHFPLTHVGNQVGPEYYANVLTLYTMGLLNETTGRGVAMMWGDSKGSHSGENLISCLLRILQDPRQHLGARRLRLVFDNSAVNKNKYLTGFAQLLVRWGWFEEVTLQYLVVGHTKYSPDRMFGWLSGQIRRINLYSLEQIISDLNALRTPTSRYSVELFLERVAVKEVIDEHFHKLPGISGRTHKGNWHAIRARVTDRAPLARQDLVMTRTNLQQKTVLQLEQLVSERRNQELKPSLISRIRLEQLDVWRRVGVENADTIQREVLSETIDQRIVLEHIRFLAGESRSKFHQAIQQRTDHPLPEYEPGLFRLRPPIPLPQQAVDALKRLQPVILEPLLPPEMEYLRDTHPDLPKEVFSPGAGDWVMGEMEADEEDSKVERSEGKEDQDEDGDRAEGAAGGDEVSQSNPSIHLMRYEGREFISDEPVARSASNSGRKRKAPQGSSSAGSPANRLEPGSSRQARSASSRNRRGNEDAAAASSRVGEPLDQQLERDKRPSKRRRR